MSPAKPQTSPRSPKHRARQGQQTAAKRSTGDILSAARRVLKIESAALETLSETLGENFGEAVDCLAAIIGRIIVSGIGKSGHIAHKIAATLASTGSPAHFVHPAEASHGDLGMITPADALLILSNSGENEELKDLIAHTRRFSIPLISISSQADSTLVDASDIALLLPGVPEACPMGLAPTTSTTMMVALGDALAVALMQMRGFSIDDYRVLHPGGQLGKFLIRVKDIMHGAEALPLVSPETAMSEVLITMTAKGFGCAGVIDKQKGLIGIITDGDLRRHMAPDLLAQSAAKVMTQNPKTIRANAFAAEAVAFMNNSKPPFLCVFVLDDYAKETNPVGILHMHDCLRAGIV